MCRPAPSIKAEGKPVVKRVWRALTTDLEGSCHRLETPPVSAVRLHRLPERAPPTLRGRNTLFLLARESRYTFAAMRYPFRLALIFACSIMTANALACASRPSSMSEAEKTAIADSLKKIVVSAYDLSRPDPVASLMSLYPPSGRVLSASGGVVTTTRPELEKGIRAFWTYVGQNMKQPRWEWTSMNVDVLAPDAAVMTSTYRIPHLTPMGMNHVIAGAWTAVFQKRDGRWEVIQEHLSDVQSNLNLPADSTMQMQH